MNRTTFYSRIVDGTFGSREIALACLDEAGRPEVEAAFTRLRPGDGRLHHVVREGKAALDGCRSANHHGKLECILIRTISDLTRWQSTDWPACTRAVAAVQAVLAALRAAEQSLLPGRERLVAISACGCARRVADAVIEPEDDVRDRIVAAATERVVEAEWAERMAACGPA